MKIVGVIPARYKSSRFEGKPLQYICGKPMVWWAYQNASKVESIDEVYVATEDTRVAEICAEYGLNCVMTSDAHPTGTDRVGEVAQKVAADIYVVLMGDEPLIKSEDIAVLINEIKLDDSIKAGMLTTKFKNPVDVVNTTSIKLAINDYGDLIFMSRSAIPFPKAYVGYSYYKNMGCYVFKKNTLDFYLKTKPGNIEKAEEIELLRLLENHMKVKTVLVESDSISVDTPKDLERVRKIISER